MSDEHETSNSLDELFSSPRSVDQQRGRRHPFKFLDPYGPSDRDIFFGRDAEIRDLYSCFYRDRLALLYGESGSGKTSLIRCGLRPDVPPEDAVFVEVRFLPDLAPLQAVRREVISQLGLSQTAAPDDTLALLRQAARTKSKTLVLVFDQFEELFISHPRATRGILVTELAEWLAAAEDGQLDLRVIIAIREEYYAKLSELETALPAVFDNRCWVRRMSREQAELVVMKPCEHCGVALERTLTDALTTDLGWGGQGVELPMLQVVLDTLYGHAVAESAEAPKLTHSVYCQLGGASAILGRFVEDRVAAYANASKARQVLKAMVTAEGTKRMAPTSEIQRLAAQFGDPLTADEVDEILRGLLNDRVLREASGQGYLELRHDFLAGTIHLWMTGGEKKLIEARATFDSRLKEYNARGRCAAALLDQASLDYLTPFLDHMSLSGEGRQFLDDSRRMRQRRATRRRRLRIAAFVALAGVAGVALWGWNAAHQYSINLMRLGALQGVWWRNYDNFLKYHNAHSDGLSVEERERRIRAWDNDRRQMLARRYGGALDDIETAFRGLTWETYDRHGPAPGAKQAALDTARTVFWWQVAKIDAETDLELVDIAVTAADAMDKRDDPDGWRRGYQAQELKIRELSLSARLAFAERSTWALLRHDQVDEAIGALERALETASEFCFKEGSKAGYPNPKRLVELDAVTKQLQKIKLRLALILLKRGLSADKVRARELADNLVALEPAEYLWGPVDLEEGFELKIRLQLLAGDLAGARETISAFENSRKDKTRRSTIEYWKALAQGLEDPLTTQPASEYVRGHLLFAGYLAHDKRFDEAERHYALALESCSRLADFERRVRRADVLSSWAHFLAKERPAGDLPRALRFSEESVSLLSKPYTDFLDALMIKAMVLARLGREEEAARLDREAQEAGYRADDMERWRQRRNEIVKRWSTEGR